MDEWREGYEGTCEVCGRLAPIQLLTDPFEDEGIIEPTETQHAYCKSCYLQRKDEV